MTSTTLTFPTPSSLGSLDHYIQSVNRFPLLTQEQETALGSARTTADALRAQLDTLGEAARQAQRALANGELDRRFRSRELAFGFYGQANAHLMSHLIMPGSRLNRKKAERIVDLFLAGAAPKRDRN